MIQVFRERWHGVLALIWLPCGLVLLWLIERFLDPLIREYFASLWMLGGCLVPTALLAYSGLRNGNRTSRICAALALVALAAPIVLLVWAGFLLTNH